VRARAVLVSDPATCDDVNTSTSYLADTINLSPDSGAQVAAGGSYATWSLDPGTYSINDSGVAGYALRLACWATDVLRKDMGRRQRL